MATGVARVIGGLGGMYPPAPLAAPALTSPQAIRVAERPRQRPVEGHAFEA